MGRRLLRAMGAGLMEGGKQAELSRRERLEQQKSDRLLEIQNRRLDLMGEQNRSQSEYQSGMIGLRERQIEGDIEGRADQAAHNLLMQTGQQDAAAATSAYQTQASATQEAGIEAAAASAQLVADAAERRGEAQLTAQNIENELRREGLDDAKITQAKTAMGTFRNTEMPAVWASYANTKDHETNALRVAAIQNAGEAGLFSMKTSDAEAYIDNIDEVLGEGATGRKLDKKAFKKFLGDVKTRRDIMQQGFPEGMGIDDMQLYSLVMGARPDPEDATAATAPSLAADVAAGKGGLETERGWRGKSVFGDTRDVERDPELVADVIGQGLDNMLGGDDFTSATGTTAYDVRALRDMATSDEGIHGETLTEGLRNVERNWSTISERYPNLKGKTYQEALPLIRQLLQMEPGANPQTGLGLMNGMNLSEGMEEFAPGNDAALMGGFDPSKNYT